MLLFRHQLGNKLLTFLTNLVTNLNLTDMETCYKAVRTDLLRSIPIVSNDFRLEPELTIKLAKREARIFEVPISYSGRTYQEGKKIGWRDGVKALARHPPLLARRRRLRPRRARLADARAAGPGPAVQRLDGRRDPPVPGVPAAGDRIGDRKPDPPPRPPRRLRGQRREPALREDAREPHQRPALPGGPLHRRHRPRLLSPAGRGVRLGGLPERHRARRRRRGRPAQHPRRPGRERDGHRARPQRPVELRLARRGARPQAALHRGQPCAGPRRRPGSR